MKRFNSTLFIVCTVLLACLAYESYLQAVAVDEGHMGTGAFRHFIASIFNIMRFPMHNILTGWSRNPFNFAIGLIINCLLYSLLLERIVYYITRPKPEDEYQ